MNPAPHPVSARTSLLSRIARHGGAAMVAGLCWVASTAQAVGLSVTHGSGLPGGTASVSFDVDFDQGTPLSEFYLALGDASPALPFVGGTAFWNGLALSDAAVPTVLSDASGTWGSNYSFGLALSVDPDPLHGLLHLTYTYDLTSFTAGQSASVELLFEVYDSDLGESVTLSRTATITAVPEADAGLLALAGLGVAAGVLARRRARDRTQQRTHQDAPALA